MTVKVVSNLLAKKKYIIINNQSLRKYLAYIIYVSTKMVCSSLRIAGIYIITTV